MQQFLPILFLCFSANIDTLFMAMCYGARRIYIPFKFNVLIACISTLGTWLFLMIGSHLNNYLPAWVPDIMGGILLVAIGIFVLIGFIFNKTKSNEMKEVNTKTMSIMALTLTVNNAGIGLAAGLAGYNILLSVITTFLLTIACVIIGNITGKSILNKIFGRYSELITALLLIVLGIYGIF